ncbi:MAG: membrane protein insertion efficiency factor YidD [bacterium]
MRYLGIAILKIYQRVVSPLLPPSCRFYPSCSEYTLQAISKYGLIVGIWKGMNRLIKCHPFNPGGYDPLN